jgi:hypothetical protein
VLVREQAGVGGLAEDGIKKRPRDVAVEQPIAILVVKAM